MTIGRGRVPVLAGALGAIALGGCGLLNPQQPLTRDRCEAQPGFVFVPAGRFVAGSDTAERDYAYQISAAAVADSPAEVEAAEQRLRDRGWFDHERDRQSLTLAAFCISANLVTQAEYQAFVTATGHRAPGISAADYQAQGFLVHPYAAVAPYQWQDNQPPLTQRSHPVVLVSHADAQAYAAWKSEQDGVRYRLPSALEWEKAARGTDGRYFPWGDEWQAEATNWSGEGPYGTSAIATYPESRSSYGVEDMAGNVFEYTRTTRSGSPHGPEVVMKGCSWDDLPGFCRAAYFHTRPVNSRHILFGFRLVME